MHTYGGEDRRKVGSVHHAVRWPKRRHEARIPWCWPPTRKAPRDDFCLASHWQMNNMKARRVLPRDKEKARFLEAAVHTWPTCVFTAISIAELAVATSASTVTCRGEA